MATKIVLGNLGDIYDYIAFVMNQEELGEVVNAKNINTLLYTAVQQFYKQEYDKILQALQIEGTEIGTKIFYNSPLSVFLKNADVTTLAIPSDCQFTIGGVGIAGTVPQPLEFLNEESFNRRIYNVLGASLKRHPVFKELNGQYVVVPNTITDIKVDYLAKQTLPVFDYCQGLADDEIYYMPAGYELRNDTGVINLYDSSVATIPTVNNVVHYPTPSSYPYVSISVELQYKDVDKMKIADMIVVMASERSRELNMAQIASNEAKT